MILDDLYEDGRQDEARELANQSNLDLLRLLSLAAYAAEHEAECNMRALKCFQWKHVLSTGDRDKNLKHGLLVNENAIVLTNPPLHEVLDLEEGSNILCTPMHFLRLLRFALTRRVGKLKALAISIEAWKAKKEKKKQSSARHDAITKLAESADMESKQLMQILRKIPSLDDLALEMRREMY